MEENSEPGFVQGLVIEPGDLTAHTHCPICGSGDLRKSEDIEFRKAAIHYDRCGHCELMFMNPMPSQSWYNRFYAEEFWEGKNTEGKSVKQSGKKEFKIEEQQSLKELHRAQVLFRFLADNNRLPPRGARILEIGCAFGLIGRSLAARVGGVSFGVEPSDAARAFAKTHVGVNVIARNTDELSQWNQDAPVDLVIFSNVLENIVDPIATLSQVHRMLATNGQLVIETPNPVFQRSTSIYHPFVYSARAIKHLVTRSGFDIKAYETNGLPRNKLIPRFQRLIAVKMERKINPLSPPKPGVIPFPLRRRAGLSFWTFGKWFRQDGAIDGVAQTLLEDVKKSMRDKRDSAGATS